MNGIVGVAGTPATGKKTTAPLLAGELGMKCAGLNELASSYGLARRAEGETEVDTEALGRKLQGLAGPLVVYGHLLPFVLRSRSVSKVVVLRCDPSVLKLRLQDRGYRPRKVVDNLEAELIGVVSSDAYDAFGQDKVFELDSTREPPSDVATAAARVIRGLSPPGPRIDWTASYDSGAKLRSLLSVAEA